MNYNTFAQYAKTENVQNASFYAEALGVAKALVELWSLRVESKKS
jgi:hypothetical protein